MKTHIDKECPPRMWNALSVRQPWAWLIVNGYKPIENRTWHTHMRGPILIHAGLTMMRNDWLAAQRIANELHIEMPSAKSLDRGGIVGAAVITGCVTRSQSPWFAGAYGFLLEEAIKTPFFGCRGQLGFFTVGARCGACAQTERRVGRVWTVCDYCGMPTKCEWQPGLSAIGGKDQRGE